MNDILDIPDVDQVEFDEFFSSIQKQQDGEEENVPIPSSNLEARKWLAAYLKIDGKVDYYSKEYKDFMKKRYIAPIDEKIERLEISKEFIKDGLLKFLNNAEIDSTSFPDLATVSKTDGKDKIIYPEDEEELAKTLVASGKKDFIRTKYALDKKEINLYFADKKEVPFSGLSIENGTDGVRITKSKSYKESRTKES